MGACATTALGPLCLILVAQIGLVLLLKVRWLLIFLRFKCLSQSVHYFDNLLALSVTMRCATTFDILVPACIREAHLVLHTLFKILSGLPTAIKFSVILPKIILIKARRALVIIQIPILISFSPVFLIVMLCVL